MNKQIEFHFGACLSKLHANIVKHICKENGLKPVKTFTK